MSETFLTDVSVDEALGLLATFAIAPQVVDTVPLALASSRLLAEDCVARWPMPRFDQAAVDGWAVALGDCARTGETHLPAMGRLAAGDDPGARVVAGTALRIFTGAMLPADARAVVMQEQVRREGDTVVLPAGLRDGQNIRRCGEQAAAGATLLRSGRRLGPADLALAAGGGLTTLACRAPLRVGILSTGNEIRPLGAPLPAATVPDQNGLMLAALVTVLGAQVVTAGLVGDDAGVLATRLVAMAAACDLVLTTGGVSVGEEDHLRSALSRVGRLMVWRVAMRPGRPTALGWIGSTPLLALPGPPTAAYIAFTVLGRPLMQHLIGEVVPAAAAPSATLAFDHVSPRGITEFLPVTLLAGPTGLTAHREAGPKGGVAALGSADALARIAAEREILAPGEPVVLLPLVR